ncbi:MAG: lipoate--protein ligase LplJ [Calditrichia bacterium]
MLVRIDNKGVTDPYLNLALEEYALRNLEMNADYVLFYINQPAVIIGRHQNPWEEVNMDFVEREGIPVIRRISGGGAVYHDAGNLNFSFITPYTKAKFNNYQKFTEPIIQTLRSLGVEAKLNQRNAIVVGDYKISGNAQFTSKNRMVSHGTLLFHTNLHHLKHALQQKSGDIESRATKSIRSKVVNISSLLNRQLTVEKFQNLLLQGISKSSGGIISLRFSSEDWEKIEELARNKYQSWSWNFGESPSFHLKWTKKLRGREIHCQMVVEKGKIKEIKFSGDFAGDRFFNNLEKLLEGLPYEKAALRQQLKKMKPDFNRVQIGEEELLAFIY